MVATLLRVAVGFGLGMVVGTLFGAIAGYWTFIRRLIDPTLQGLRAVPSIAWIPLFILWRIENSPKYAKIQNDFWRRVSSYAFWRGLARSHFTQGLK